MEEKTIDDGADSIVGAPDDVLARSGLEKARNHFGRESNPVPVHKRGQHDLAGRGDEHPCSVGATVLEDELLDDYET